MPISRVLIVDDSPTERQFLTEVLTSSGYQVFTADTGEEGVEKSKTLKPDLVLMDVVMPGLNGFQATRMITKEGATKHIPVILCTTKSQETDRVWGMRQGAKDYVTKPVDAKELLSKIKAIG